MMGSKCSCWHYCGVLNACCSSGKIRRCDYVLQLRTSLCKNFQIWKTTEAALKHHLPTDLPKSQPRTDTMFVLDGSDLHHRGKWLLKLTYSEVTAKYLRYTKANYGSLRNNFYRYNAIPSIKDREHQQRTARSSANIQIEDGLQVAVHQELFL